MTDKKPPLGSEDNPRPSPGFYDVLSKTILEQVEGGKFAGIHLFQSGRKLRASVESKININGTWYRPLPSTRVYWNLPGYPMKYESEEWLFDANRQFIYDYGDVKEPGAYDVLAAFALATWRFEDWQSFPFLGMVGHYGAGKSTLQRILKQICRRAVGGPSISVSAFVSMMDRFQATIMPDEAQILNSDDSPEMIAVLRGAYQKGNQRIKSVPTGHGWTDKASNAYGFVAWAAHDPLEEGILQRSLTFSMVKRTRKLEKWRKPEFLMRGSHLRNWNLQYRFLNLGRDDVDDELLDQIQDDRLQELALPLLTVAPLKARESILSFFKVLEKRKQLEIESGEEADYFRALDFFTTRPEFIKAPGGRILFAAFKERLLAIKKEEDPEYDPKWLSPRAMWKVLDRLGFHHGGHLREGSSITFDVNQIEAQRPRFSDQAVLSPMSFPPSTVTVVTPVTSIEKSVKDVTEVMDTGVKGESVKCEYCKRTMTRKEYQAHECPVGDPTGGTNIANWMPEGEAGGLTDSDYDSRE